MGIDFGDSRIGIAFSDLMQIIASPYEIYQTKSEEEDLKYLSDLAKKNEVSKIIFGLPYNMDGSEGERAVITKQFAQKLREVSGLEIEFQDERLSSVEAEDMLREAKVKWQDRKKFLDKLSASIILETYMKTRR